MKHLKKFNEDKKSPRFEIDDNQVITSGLPTNSKDGDTQEIGFDPEQMNLGGSNAYNYLTLSDDIDDKDAEKFITKHVKPFDEWKKKVFKKTK